MNMVKIKTSELEGAQLDFAVAIAGEEWKTAHKFYPTMTLDSSFKSVALAQKTCYLIPNNPMRQDQQVYSPSTDWSQGGPIIEREKIIILPPLPNMIGWYACIDEQFESIYQDCDSEQSGETPLIAAMRVFVASKIGDVVEIPEVEL